MVERIMSRELSLVSVPDDELLERLSTLVDRHRRCEAELVAHLAEVDARKLYLGKACSSMFRYCVEALHLSEHEAYLRIACARASRRFPVLLDMLADGATSVSAACSATRSPTAIWPTSSMRRSPCWWPSSSTTT